MSTIEGRKARLAAAVSVSQYLECAVNFYLRSRELFPASSFSNHTRFGQSYLLCDIKDVKQYIKQSTSSIQNLFLHDRVNEFIILASDKHNYPIERFVLEFPTDFGKAVFYSLPLSNASRVELETYSLCSTVLREALTALERKLGRSRVDNDRQIAFWEVFVDVKRSCAQATECMDMPSGWTLASELPVITTDVFRHPVKSSCVGESVGVLSYVDSYK